jgi:hypothetical protein
MRLSDCFARKVQFLPAVQYFALKTTKNGLKITSLGIFPGFSAEIFCLSYYRIFLFMDLVLVLDVPCQCRLRRRSHPESPRRKIQAGRPPVIPSLHGTSALPVLFGTPQVSSSNPFKQTEENDLFFVFSEFNYSNISMRGFLWMWKLNQFTAVYHCVNSEPYPAWQCRLQLALTTKGRLHELNRYRLFVGP